MEWRLLGAPTGVKEWPSVTDSRFTSHTGLNFAKWAAVAERRSASRVHISGSSVPSGEKEALARRSTLVTRIALLVVLASLAGCVSTGSPGPDAIYRHRHPVTGDVQWCDKPSGVGMALSGAIVAASQGDYAGCKTNWESKEYVRLPSTVKLPLEDQRRYEEERDRRNQALADSIRKNETWP